MVWTVVKPTLYVMAQCMNIYTQCDTCEMGTWTGGIDADRGVKAM